MSEEKYNLEGIERLFMANHKALCNLANRILRNRDTAEDIVQEVFIKIWQKRDEIKIESTLKGYLFKAVANAALNELQRIKKFQYHTEIKEDQLPSVDPVSHESDQGFLEQKIQEALDDLPPKCKVIFTLSRYENLKYKEIAEQLDISVKTVEAQMGIALEKMRLKLKPYLTRQF